MTNTPITKSASTWQRLYQIAGAAALVLVVYSLVTMIIVFAIGGQPETAEEVFAVLQDSRLMGLLRLDVLTVLCVPLYYPIFLALTTALQPTHRSYAALALGLSFAGITLFLAAPSVFSWLTLSDKFAAAADETRRVQLLAAGEAILAADTWHGTGPWVGGLLMQIAAVLMSVVMLGSRSFARATAYTGLVTHGLEVVRIPLALFFPLGSFVLLAIAGPLYLVWFPLLARDLFRLGGEASPGAAA